MITVLQVHNRYQEPGGEDVAVAADASLLERAGHRVVRYERTNDEITHLGPLGRGELAIETLWSRRSRRQIAELMDRARPDVVHAHNTFPLISPSIFAAARAHQIPVVQTVHNYRMVCASAVLARDGVVPCHDCLHRTFPLPAVVHRCYRDSRTQSGVLAAYQTAHRLARTWDRYVTRYLAVSAYMADLLVNAGAVPADRIDVRPNFCEPDPGSRDPHTNAKGVVFAGRITKEKGVETLVRAAALAPGVEVRIAGDGPYRADAERLSRQLGATDVRFLGHLDRSALLALIRSARCVAYTSISEEPSSLVLLEAAALGVPAIASAVGGAPEIVTNATGILVPPGDVAALAAAMRDTHWSARGPAARARYEQEFSADHALNRLLAAYRRAGVAVSP
jgi:glycosyltransferase involved in cell wall biosynthesis